MSARAATTLWPSSSRPRERSHRGDSGRRRMPMTRRTTKTSWRPMGTRQDMELST